MKKKNERVTLKSIQKRFVRIQMVLIVSLAVFLGVAGIIINIRFENEKRDQNLQNVARTIASSPILDNTYSKEGEQLVLHEYLDSEKTP